MSIQEVNIEPIHGLYLNFFNELALVNFFLIEPIHGLYLNDKSDELIEKIEEKLNRYMGCI